MSSNNIYTAIYGQRIPYSLCRASFVLPAEAGIQSNPVVSTLDPSLRWDDKVFFVEVDFDQAQTLPAQPNIIPVLRIEENLEDNARKLFQRGFSRIALSVDEDSAAIKSLSPRFSDADSRNRSKEQIGNAIRSCASQGPTLVALTVEELCPGGLDPTEGIALAREFVACGATGIIASGGTQDFLPLKIRRPTKLKESVSAETWPETWLSSALWLVGNVDVPIYAQGIVNHPEETLTFAAIAGLSGVIDISVKYPSSPLTM